jgi:hypothetical protein
MVIWLWRIKYRVAETPEWNVRDRYRLGSLHTVVTSIAAVIFVVFIVVDSLYWYGFQNTYLG